jgi:hypothetical protein
MNPHAMALHRSPRRAKEAQVAENVNNKLIPIVLLFLLATTLFNTMRANRVENASTTFRKEARYQIAITREALANQQQINARLQQQLDELRAAQAPSEPAP